MKYSLLHILSLFMVVIVVVISNKASANDWVQPSSLRAPQYAAAETLEPGVTPDKGRFLISKMELGESVAKILQEEGIAGDIQATVVEPAAPAIYQHNKAITLKLHALNVSAERQAWQAEAYVMSEGKTLAVIPVSGRYQIMQRIPVLARALTATDTIEKGDISYITLPDRQLRKDTITDAASLIGYAPRNHISPHRSIRATEIVKPRLITKKSQVEMLYSSQYVTIRSVGEALENGSEGDLIRVKNTDSDRAVTARVVGAGKVEVNLARTM